MLCSVGRVLGIVPFPFHLCTYCIHADDGIQAQLFCDNFEFPASVLSALFIPPGVRRVFASNRGGVGRDFSTLTFAASSSFIDFAKLSLTTVTPLA